MESIQKPLFFKISKPVSIIMVQGLTPMMAMRSKVRTAQNVMDYKRVIVDRTVDPDMSRKPRDPRVIYPRLRSKAAYANR